MRAEAFMDYLFYAMVAAGVLLAAWMVITRVWGVDPASMRPDFAAWRVVWGHVKMAWRIFPGVAAYGWLVSIVLIVLTVTITMFTIAVVAKELPSADAMESMLHNQHPLTEQLVNMLFLLPLDISHSAKYLTDSFGAASNEPFILIMAYCAWRFKGSVRMDRMGDARKLFRYLMYCAVVVLPLTAAQLTQLPFSTKIIATPNMFGLFGIPVSIIKYCILLLPATVLEGMLLTSIYGILDDSRPGVRDAFEDSLLSVKPLYLFNLCFFGVPYALRKLGAQFFSLDNTSVFGGDSFNLLQMTALGRELAYGVVWLLQMVFFLTPYIIVRQQVTLADALRKTVAIISVQRTYYAILAVSVSIAAVLASNLLSTLSNYVVLPVFRNIFALWMFDSVVPSVFFIWYSLFVVCLFAVYNKSNSETE